MEIEKNLTGISIEELKKVFIDVIKEHTNVIDNSNLNLNQNHKILERIANRYYTISTLEKFFDINFYEYKIHDAGLSYKKVHQTRTYKLIDVIEYLKSKNIDIY